MSSKNVNKIGQSTALESTNLNSATKPKSSGTSMKSSKAKALTSTDMVINQDAIVQSDDVMPLEYTDYPPFSEEQHTRVSDTYKSIADKMSGDKMAKTIQDQFLKDITAKSGSYLERVEAGEDIENIRTEQAEFLNGLIEGIFNSIETINASKANADDEMKTIISKIIVDLIKSNELTIDLAKNESIENDKLSVKLVIEHSGVVIYEGEEIVLMESTNTTPDPVTDEEI